MCSGASIRAKLFSFMHYESVRYIRVNNWTIGILFWLMTFAMIGYIVGYQIVVNKGYQRYDTALGTVQIKVKGAVSVGAGADLVTYDANDVVMPPLEHDALFVQTKYVHTGPQLRGTCAGNDPATEKCTADSSALCAAGHYTVNGVANGTCDTTAGYCFVQGWCPAEDDTDTIAIDHVPDMTLFIRVNALFPAFGISVNSLPFQNLPQPYPNAGAGVQSVGQLLALADVPATALNDTGVILMMAITYDCDLNYSPDSCVPKFTISRIDNAGMNYRYITLGADSAGNDQRDLYKVWGLRLVVYVSGKGGQYDTAALAITIGAGIGLLSVAGVVCDFFLSSCARRKAEYNSRRVELVVDSDPHPTDEVPESNFRALADERAAAAAQGPASSPSRF